LKVLSATHRILSAKKEALSHGSIDSNEEPAY
jgi:hypothetical protein